MMFMHYMSKQKNDTNLIHKVINFRLKDEIACSVTMNVINDIIFSYFQNEKIVKIFILMHSMSNELLNQQFYRK